MKAQEIKTIEDAQNYCEGVLNDFESGICTKAEAMKHLLQYTAQMQTLFFKNTIKAVKANPKLLE